MFPFHGVIKQKNISIRTTLICGVACVSVLLGACDVRGDAWKNGPVKIADVEKAKAKAAAEEGVSRLEKADSLKLPPVKTVAASNGKGLNPKNLFSGNLRSDQERIDRLERALQGMRNDFDLVQPSIKRLISIEADIQNLVGELRKLSKETTQAKEDSMEEMVMSEKLMMEKEKAAIKSKKKPKKVQTKSPPTFSGKPEIYDVRIGEHPGKTRIVLDSNAKASGSFSVDIDNDEQIMVVDLPNTKWSAATSKSIHSKIVSSYRVEESDNGSLLVFDLRRNANVLSQDEIAGARGAGRRIVIDLK